MADDRDVRAVAVTEESKHYTRQPWWFILVGGAVGAGVLCVRSHIRSLFWANLVLWSGIVGVAAGVSVLLAVLS